LLARRKAYAAIRAARGTLHWDDSDEAWAKVRAERQAKAALKPGVKTSRPVKSLEAA
jgi:antitoxin ParD1/3/4